ncbi:glycosyltransferase family 2 protein [Aquabacter spiritensis]|nr:glycosyltransferase family 2 protein [Aquabacter spiritensis]
MVRAVSAESASRPPESSHPFGTIPPIWLRAEPLPGGARRHALPLAFKLQLFSSGRAVALEIGGADPEAVIRLDILAADGRVVGTSRVSGRFAAVFLPRGAAAIRSEGGGEVRLGVFPRSKIGLKLHAFLRGAFPAQSAHRRWRTAAAEARDLRGMHATLIEASPAREGEQAVRYRRYRSRHVEDFGSPVPPRTDLHLTFIGRLEGAAADAAARLAALERQTDADWSWIAILPAAADPALAAFANDTLVRHPKVRLLITDAPPAASINAALAEVADGLVACLPDAGLPLRDAVAMLRATFAAHPDCRLAYTDEERLGPEGEPVGGLFKPAFNRHLLRAGDYLGDLVAIRSRVVADLGGLRPDFGAAARYDLLLRALETGPSTTVRHIPRVAFSAPERARDCGAPPDPVQAARALEAALGTPVEIAAAGRLRAHARVPQPPPLVSIVIPTRDRADLLGTALRSLIALTSYRAFEIVIVDNGSVEPQTFALFEETKAAWPDTRIVRDDGSFNYPRICNAGVAEARGSILCLLNNDIEIVDPGWLDEMVGLVVEPRTGIVGAKLLFPDRTTQHAGVVVGLFRYAAHWFVHAAADVPGPFARLVCRNNVSAVTGACLMIRRACWDTIGPLDAVRFAEDCNDIDLCLRARRAGFEVVFTPYAQLIHHESASRGRKRSRSHRNRLKAQRQRMEDLWGTDTLVDPHYNPNLSRTSLHAALAAAPEGPRHARTDEI